MNRKKKNRENYLVIEPACCRLLRAPAQVGRFALIFERRLFGGHPLTWRLNFDVGGFCMALLNAAESIDGSLRVVAIGGGTGLSTLLRGLKRYVVTPDRRKGIRIGGGSEMQRPPAPPSTSLRCVIRELSAVVTVTDDGGSSGRLREDFKMLPPGDIRNCMVELSEDEHLLSKLFQFRFEHGDLEGHSFGNLFLAALSHITADFAQAVQMSSQILAARGKIFPSTNTNVRLAAQMEDGSVVRGETNITASQRTTIVELRLEAATAAPRARTVVAVSKHDAVTLWPAL